MCLALLLYYKSHDIKQYNNPIHIPYDTKHRPYVLYTCTHFDVHKVSYSIHLW